MSNVYLLYGENDYLINKKIEEIKDKYNNYDIVSYDMTIDNISSSIEDLSMNSLFSTDKIVICYNCVFLNNAKCDIDHKIDYLSEYLNNASSNILILVTDTIDKRKKIVKDLLKENAYEFKNLNDYELNSFITDYCKKNGFKISSDALMLFKTKLTNNLYIICSELDKLFLCCDKTINKSDIELITSRMINSNIFDLINAIVRKDIDKSLELYDDLVLINEEEIKLIVTLANQFRLIYQVKNMFKSGYTEADIARELSVHPYRVKVANGVYISNEDNIKYLSKLSKLDEDIKTGKVDKREGFTNFILGL